MPLLLLCLIRAFERGSLRWTLLGGAAAGDRRVRRPPATAAVPAVRPDALCRLSAAGRSGPTGGRSLRVVGLLRAVWGAGVRARGDPDACRATSSCACPIAQRPTTPLRAVGFSLSSCCSTSWRRGSSAGCRPTSASCRCSWPFSPCASSRHPLLPYWVLLATLGLVISLGGNSFFHSLLYLLGPAYALFQHQERAIYLYTLAMALLAGYGAAFLARPLTARQRRALVRLGWIGLAGVVAALVVAGVIYAGYLLVEATNRAYRWRDVLSWYNWFVFMFCLSLGLLAARLFWCGGQRIVLAALPAGPPGPVHRKLEPRPVAATAQSALCAARRSCVSCRTPRAVSVSPTTPS